MRIAIVGPGRSGKDEAAEWFVRNTTLRYTGSCSSHIAPEIARIQGISAAEAFAGRHRDAATRELWRATGDRMRERDPAALARLTLQAGDLVVGVRARVEMEATRGLVDLVLWVDRPGVPDDPTLEFGFSFADVVVPNRWDLPAYHARLHRLASALGVLRCVR